MIRVTGAVRRRPEGMANPQLATGEVEVAARELEVLSTADTPPFVIEDRVEAVPAGEYELKGFGRPVPALDVVAVREAELTEA